MPTAHYDAASSRHGKEGPRRSSRHSFACSPWHIPRGLPSALQSAKEVVLLEPYCFRAHDAMSEFQGVSTQHVATMIGPQALEQLVSSKLAQIDEVPKSVKDQLDDRHRDHRRRPSCLTRRARRRTTRASRRWGALAILIRETHFVQVFRRLYFMKNDLAVPVDEYWNEVRPEVAGHRYSPTWRRWPSTHPRWPRFHQFADTIDLADIETTENDDEPEPLELSGGRRAKAAWHIAMCPRGRDRRNGVASLAKPTSRSNCADGPKNTQVQSVSMLTPGPCCIEKDWESVKDQVAAWEKESGDFPAVLGALGSHYSQSKKYDDAERVLSRYIVLSPDRLGVSGCWPRTTRPRARSTAGRRRSTSSWTRWKISAWITRKVRIEIADYYMGLKQWDKARPYAERRATVGSAGRWTAPPGAPRDRKTGTGPKPGTGATPSGIPTNPGRSGISSASERATAT